MEGSGTWLFVVCTLALAACGGKSKEGADALDVLAGDARSQPCGDLGQDVCQSRGVVCSDLDKKACGESDACMVVEGWPQPQACQVWSDVPTNGPAIFQDCVPAGACGGAFTWAYPPDAPDLTWLFPSACIPEGWQELDESPCCMPDCEGKECGDDGCEGYCGFCGEEGACQEYLGGPSTCIDAVTAACSKIECGVGMWGECDYGGCWDVWPWCPCPAGEVCVSPGTDTVLSEEDAGDELDWGGTCVPASEVCGNGVCDAIEACENCLSCAEDCPCPEGESCVGEGECQCFPDCAGNECGDDGCGGSCGTCGTGRTCLEGQCEVDCGNGQCEGGEDKCNCPGDCTDGCEGCCLGTLCRDGTANWACGTNGDVCVACSKGNACVSGQCLDGGGLEWVAIPGGTFTMGCSPGDKECWDDENPPHSVTVSSFELLETEVTEAQFKAVMDQNPSCDHGSGGGPNSPVECISWYAAKAFCLVIGSRLPTEAEWEYAARGGTTTKYYCGDGAACPDDVAWYASNSEDHKHDSKGKAPNAYGLYDMLGNVWEWTEDCWHEDYDLDNDGDADWMVGYPDWSDGCLLPTRIVRGGSFVNFDFALRVSERSGAPPKSGAGVLGFRCARSVEP